jgi:hypothetical protein
MRRLPSVVSLAVLLALLPFVTVGPVPAVTAAPSIYQGDLILSSNNVTVIDGPFDINGSIVVEENATLILTDATVTFTPITGNGLYLQNPVNGYPRLIAMNSTLNGVNGRYYGNGTLSFENCTLVGSRSLYFYDDTNVTVVDTDIGNDLNVRDASRVTLVDSSTGAVTVTARSTNCSILDHRPGFVEFWDFALNCSAVVSPFGSAPNVTLHRSTVSAWSFSFQDSSSAEILRSDIQKVHANEDAGVVVYNSTLYDLELYGASVVELWNTTHQLDTFSNTATAILHWYLAVHVVDAIAQDVPAANVTVIFPNATVAASTLADAEGWAWFTLLETQRNATGAYPVGNYTVDASYSGYKDTASVNLTANEQVELLLEGFVIPEFPSVLLLLALVAVTLVAVGVTRTTRHVRRPVPPR